MKINHLNMNFILPGLNLSASHFTKAAEEMVKILEIYHELQAANKKR